MKTLAAALFMVPALAFAQPATGGGVPFPRETAAPPAAVAPARAALTDELYGASPPLTAARLDLEHEALLVRASSGAVCGNAVGCPTAVMVRNGASWKAVWTGMTFGRGTVLSTSHGGLRDIALAAPRGSRLLRFDGTSYVEAKDR